MKRYDIYISGSERICTIYSTCISKACKSFIGTLKKPDGKDNKSEERCSSGYG